MEMQFNFDTMTVEWYGARKEMKEANNHQMMFWDNNLRDTRMQPKDDIFLYWLEQMNMMIQEEQLDAELQDENFGLS